MKHASPLITLMLGAVLGAALLMADVGLTSAVRDSAATSATAPVPIPVAQTSAPTRAVAPTASSAAASVDAVPLPAKAVYAGRVNGGGSLSILVSGHTVVAYDCSGHVEAWLWGAADGARVTLHDRTGDLLTATGVAGGVTGVMTVKGRTRTFTLSVAHRPSGLYRATATVRGATVVAGWVVLPDGSQVGAWSTDGRDVTPAPVLDLTTGRATIAGSVLTATAVDAATATF